jgi:acyl dehydratase
MSEAASDIAEEVRSWIGEPRYASEAEFDVERGYIYTSCASVENGNPLFWDEKVAAELAGGPVAPPTMLQVWVRPHSWTPSGTEQPLALQLHFDLKEALGYPEGVTTENEIVYGQPVRPGDRLRSRQVLRSISDVKTTRLGTGRFWVIDVECFNQRGEWVGTDSMTLFGYRRGE